MKISVFGLGYVGSVTAACLAEMGHTVVGVDIHVPKVEAMRRGIPPVQEAGLRELLESNIGAGRLHATMDSAYAVKSTECSIIAVGTPSESDGAVDLSAVERCIESIAVELKGQTDKLAHTIIIRSTVPPGTSQRMLALAVALSGRTLGESLLGGMNPEFLREGVAIEDFFNPSVIVFGAEDPCSLSAMESLYEGISAERVSVPIRVAELVKYANNAFHALKIAFANEIGRIAEGCGIEGNVVMEILCKDDKLNISSKYLRPGFAFGGSCLPKDLRGINHLARTQAVDTPLLRAVVQSNSIHIDVAVQKIMALRPQRVGILGITFKTGTDDVRESAALHLVERLRNSGMDVRIFDVNLDHKHLLGTNRRYIEEHVPDWQDLWASSLDALLTHCDVIAITNMETAYLKAVEASVSPFTLIDLSGTVRVGDVPTQV